jgi:hypothetical protein
MATHAFVSIRHLQTGEIRKRDLGEFAKFWATSDIWKSGPIIGNDPACAVALNVPGTPGKLARLAHPSNHVYVIPIEPIQILMNGQTIGLAPGQSHRIDDRGELICGDWALRFTEGRATSDAKSGE